MSPHLSVEYKPHLLKCVLALIDYIPLIPLEDGDGMRLICPHSEDGNTSIDPSPISLL